MDVNGCTDEFQTTDKGVLDCWFLTFLPQYNTLFLKCIHPNKCKKYYVPNLLVRLLASVIPIARPSALWICSDSIRMCFILFYFCKSICMTSWWAKRWCDKWLLVLCPFMEFFWTVHLSSVCKCVDVQSPDGLNFEFVMLLDLQHWQQPFFFWLTENSWPQFILDVCT